MEEGEQRVVSMEANLQGKGKKEAEEEEQIRGREGRVMVEADRAGFGLLFWPLLWRERLVCVQPREGSGWLLW